MSDRQEAELKAYGCKSPEWFLRDHIPRYGEHFGLCYEDAYQGVLSEIVALDEVRSVNFRQMIDSGFAQKMLLMYAQRGTIAHVGERPLVIIDNWVYKMKREPTDDPLRPNYTYYSPGNPLAITPFSVMEDSSEMRHVGSITIGRPNLDGELWLADDITVEDYDVVRDCFNRLLALRVEGVTPHMDSHMDHIYIPYTLGDPDHPYDPNEIDHGPVDYEGFATELKVVA